MWQHWPGGDDFLQPPPWAKTGAAKNSSTSENANTAVTMRFMATSKEPSTIVTVTGPWDSGKRYARNRLSRRRDVDAPEMADRTPQPWATRPGGVTLSINRRGKSGAPGEPIPGGIMQNFIAWSMTTEGEVVMIAVSLAMTALIVRTMIGR
jgi:hypothetical protein